MSKDKFKEVRDDLNAVARQLAASENGASAREIVAAFRKDRAQLIRAASEMLIDMALTRLVGDVIKRRADKEINTDQNELFTRVMTDIVAVPTSGSGAGRRDRYRTIGTLSVAFAEQMVRHHLEVRRRKKDRFDDYKEVIDFVRASGASDDMTINQALAAAHRRSGSSQAKGG
jgi:predicted RNA-binding Zn ribbon-like protein